MFTYTISLKHSIILICILLSTNAYSQGNKIYLGFGGGVNGTMPNERESVSLFENLSGETQVEEYSGILHNLGNQYFFHADYRIGNLILGFKPGTYSYSFQRITNIFVGENEETNESGQKLRYFSIPLEFKYLLSESTSKPYIGVTGSYGALMQQSGDQEQSFTQTLLNAGPQTGIYIDYTSFTINCALGYNMGLNVITRKTDRYSNNGSGLISQGDVNLNNLYVTFSILFSMEKGRKLSSVDCSFPKK